MYSWEIYIFVVEIVENVLVIGIVEICVICDYVGFDFGVDVFEVYVRDMVYIVFYKCNWIKVCVGMMVCIKIDFEDFFVDFI